MRGARDRYLALMVRPPYTLTALASALALGLSSFAAGTAPAAAAAAGAPPRHASTKPRRPATPPPPEVSLAPSVSGAPGVPITIAPVGLSIEYPVMAADLGAEACPPAALVAQLRLLGSPPISLAGASQDATAPSGALAQPPQSWEAATLYSLPADFWTQLHCLLSQSADPLTVGLNLKSGGLAWAQQMVASAASAATNGLAFSLGNEPDLYYLPDYSSLDKPQANEAALAAGLYLQLAGALQPALAGAPLIGPELALPDQWQGELPHLIEALHEQTVGVHMYPLTACGSPRAVTINGLLSRSAANAPHRLAWVVADADAAGVPAIISEANSASCGGVAGVSDSPAAAVWAVRFVLSALDTGFREVRFHFSGNSYDPFVVRGGEVLTQPLESALVALNQWLPLGATLHTIAGVRGLVATGVVSSAGTTALVILENESAKPRPVVLTGAQSVHVQSLGAARAGLREAQLSATHGRIKLVVAANSLVALSP
jgi:hypothetical protein